MIRCIDREKYFGVLIAFLSVLFFGLFFCAGGYAQQKIEDFYLSNYKEGGDKEWEVKGEEAVVSDKYVEINDMNAKYFNKDDIIDIKADRAKLNKKNMDAYLNKNVYIKSEKGIEIGTDALNWEQSKNRVSTDTTVEVKKENSFKVKAKGVDADTKLNNVRFKKEVKVDLFSKDNVININCDGPLEIDYREGKAVFNNNVVVDNVQGKMIANKATVYFDAKNSQVEKVVAEGDVKVVRDDNVTFAEKAVYSQKEQKIILEGRPRLVIFPKGESKSLFGK